MVASPHLRLLPPGFSSVSTITLAFLSNQHPVDDVPIDDAKRSGTSEFHFVRDAYRSILQALRTVRDFNPITVLRPPALTLLVLALVKGFVDVVRYDVRVTTNTVPLFVTGMIIASMALLADLSSAPAATPDATTPDATTPDATTLTPIAVRVVLVVLVRAEGGPSPDPCPGG